MVWKSINLSTLKYNADKTFHWRHKVFHTTANKKVRTKDSCSWFQVLLPPYPRSASYTKTYDRIQSQKNLFESSIFDKLIFARGTGFALQSNEITGISV